MKTRCPLILVLTLLPLWPAFAQFAPPPPQINVSGSAEVKVAPDEIRLSVGVETRDQNLDVARQQNDERIAHALAFLKGAGVKDKDVQTDFISVVPDYDYNSSHVKPVAYIVRKSIEIRVIAITNFEGIVTGLLTNGVNYVQGIDFRTAQLRKYRGQAREMAIKAAKEKADAMASALGVKRGKVGGIKFEVRQNMYLISNSLQGRRHFCFDANPYAIGRRGLRRNRNVWAAASSNLSHLQLESTVYNINVNDWIGGWGGYQNRWGAQWGGFNGQANNVQNLGYMSGAANADTAAETFSVGEISVSATVNASFLIE
jgi:uncharacterized protein YggE